MARIKVLELPSNVLGDMVATPFVFIVDQAGGDYVSPALDAFKEAAGATAVLVVPDTLDIDRA